MSNNHIAVDGGPSIAWGNNYWIGSGDDVAVNPAPSDEDVLFASSDGAGTWSTIELSAQQTNDTGRTACYKDGTTFFFTVQDQIWKTTGDPTDANNGYCIKTKMRMPYSIGKPIDQNVDFVQYFHSVSEP